MALKGIDIQTGDPFTCDEFVLGTYNIKFETTEAEVQTVVFSKNHLGGEEVEPENLSEFLDSLVLLIVYSKSDTQDSYWMRPQPMMVQSDES